MTRAGFRLQYPEFTSCPDAMIDTFLVAGALQVNATAWGTFYDQGHGLITAHLLVLAPNGQMSRLAGKDGHTTYGDQFQALKEQVTACDRTW